MLTILTGRVITTKDDFAIENGLVAIEGERILYAGDASGYEIPAYAKVIDVGEGTIMPGFIDCHAHMTGSEDAGTFAGGAMFGDQLLGAAYQCGVLLDSGFTGLRDMSEAGLHLSRAVKRGALRGPRILPGGKVMGITSGHVDFGPQYDKDYVNTHDHLSYLADGADDCVRGVREQFRAGAQFIKICATGGVSSPTDRLDDVQFSPQELRAMVEEAKRHHTYVCAHCTGYEGAYQALLAGVTCIEHGVMLTQREIDLMAQMDATLVTTLWISLHVADLPGFPDWMQEKARQCAAHNRKTIEMALAAGIRIAFGTDFSNSRNTAYKTIGREFEAMVEAGMTPMHAIRAGTVNGAYLMRMEDELGVLAPGFIADITVTDGNPLEDISCIADADHISLVIANGEIVKNML